MELVLLAFEATRRRRNLEGRGHVVREAQTPSSLSVIENNYIHRKEARAIRVSGEWFVSRTSFCELMAMAGVTCPSATE